MKSSKLFKSVAAVTLALAMVVPTIAVAPAEADAASMSFNKKSALLTVGSTQAVKIKGFKGKKATWKTSNKKVATVTGKKAKGTVKAVGAGTAKITAVVKGATTTTIGGLTIKVRQKINSFAVQDSSNKAVTSISVNPGTKMVLKGIINGNAAGSTANQTVKWSSTNTKVASIKKKNATQANFTAVSNGSADIKVTAGSGADVKTVTIKVTVKGKEVTTTKAPAKATPTPWTYPKGTIYKQHYDVTRWYNPATAAQSENGHAHDGYKNNTFAIWMIGFFDNKYSSNEEEHNGTGGPELDDYKGKALSLKGDFKYEGKAQKTILLQINYTKPSDYPIMWRWENGAGSTNEKDSDGKELSIKGNSMKSDSVASNTWEKVDLSFTIPKNAVNGDKDEATGKNYGIYLYFPNKPGGALTYVKDNTFHFKNFEIKEK